MSIRNLVATPPETSAIGLEHVKRMEKDKHRAMPLPIDKIDGYFAPLMPGTICAVQAQTHNGKTLFMTHWETEHARYLARQGRQDEVIFHVDVENSIEGLAIGEFAKYSDHSVADLSRGNVRDWTKVIQAADKVAGVNIYRIADRLGVEDSPELYLTNIGRAIRHAVENLHPHKLKVACIFVDYLQALPPDPEYKGKDSDEQRRLQVRRDVYRIRRMSHHFDCPVVVGVQAKQNLQGNPGPNMLIPGIYDGEETAAIAQRFDRIISLWMPKVSHQVRQTLQHGSVCFQVTEDLMWIKVNKQRGGLPSGDSWMASIDYKTGRITA